MNSKQHLSALTAPSIQNNTKPSLDSKTIGNRSKSESGKPKIPASSVGLKAQKSTAVQGSSSMTKQPSVDKKANDDLTVKK